MGEYHKIQSIFKRDPATNMKTFLMGEFSEPEFEYLYNNEWEFTEKVDGTNIRVYLGDGTDNPVYRFGGRTDNAIIPKPLQANLHEMFGNAPASELLELGAANAILYGEGYGPGIQSGGKYGFHPSFVLFDVRIGNWWLNRSDVDDIAKKLGIKSVPVVGRGPLSEAIDMCAAGFESQWGPFICEGIVARPVVELQNRAGRRIITKVKHKDFAYLSNATGERSPVSAV